jgi:hypothetical protein
MLIIEAERFERCDNTTCWQSLFVWKTSGEAGSGVDFPESALGHNCWRALVIDVFDGIAFCTQIGCVALVKPTLAGATKVVVEEHA